MRENSDDAEGKAARRRADGSSSLVGK